MRFSLIFIFYTLLVFNFIPYFNLSRKGYFSRLIILRLKHGRFRDILIFTDFQTFSAGETDKNRFSFEIFKPQITDF